MDKLKNLPPYITSLIFGLVGAIFMAVKSIVDAAPDGGTLSFAAIGQTIAAAVVAYLVGYGLAMYHQYQTQFSSLPPSLTSLVAGLAGTLLFAVKTMLDTNAQFDVQTIMQTLVAAIGSYLFSYGLNLYHLYQPVPVPSIPADIKPFVPGPDPVSVPVPVETDQSQTQSQGQGKQ